MLQLVWMVEQRLLSYDDLNDLLVFDKKSSESDRIVQDAFAEICRTYKMGSESNYRATSEVAKQFDSDPN